MYSATRSRQDGPHHHRRHDDTAWTAIKYTDAVFDEDERRRASYAEAECTAFTGKSKKYHATARLLFRRVKRLGRVHLPDGQGELFTTHRFHAAISDTALGLIEAEGAHRRHNIIEQVFADLADVALGHLASGKITENNRSATLVRFPPRRPCRSI
ncbi:hypothetical protein GCM10011579_033310 [Streptomyces albiflavescens]|uniref:Uncharacterized protein n=1 Tax=Streptomyces albiflavescens TaxID=1623582 RepID=A0A917Y2J9_9ACTN|nr:hypothetical protein [Streptomyces albiflavescens]GGN64164.1 hypothetical protein GCM10011579_033310 [Streptomyces albiflavescens]